MFFVRKVPTASVNNTEVPQGQKLFIGVSSNYNKTTIDIHWFSRHALLCSFQITAISHDCEIYNHAYTEASP